ncbi:MAG: efflux RND transporter periplasmic adaptor subunit, partial [Proteobacteria bacterium]|nr:efflux RND transporter periplasmic adaptor subunit [Pseudomonadota bacterium]
ESDATKVEVGQPVEFTILAAPDKVYASKISYISSSVNADIRRLQVRAEVANADGMLRPEMFANVAIIIAEQKSSLAVPRYAVIYEGDEARVWVARPDKSIEMRKIKIGNVEGDFVQVLSGLAEGDKIIGRGSLFIDRLAPQGDDKN